MIKHLLIDCDGTLADSEFLAMRVAGEILNAGMRQAYPKSDCPVFDVDTFVFTHAGLHFDQMMDEGQKRLNALGHYPMNRNMMSELKTKQTIAVLTSDVEALPGATEELTGLKAAGKILDVVTSSELSRVLPCVDRVGAHLFQGVFSAHDTLIQVQGQAEYKPSPAIYLHAARVRNIFNERGLVAAAIEDSASGVKSAVAAGIPVFGIVSGKHIPADKKESHAQNLKNLGAVGVYDSWPNLAARLMLG